MMRNLAASLIEHEVIKTTVEKGKELRRFVEPLITKAKVDTLHNRRQIISQLNSKSATSKLFSNLGPRFNETNGGYLRVIKAGFREGDKADMCYVELTIRDLEQEAKVDEALVDENLVMPEGEVQETKIEEKAETAPAQEEVKTPKKATKKTTSKKEESKEEPSKKVEAPKKAAAKTTAKKEVEAKADTPKKPVKKKKAEKKEEKKSWWSRFFK
jgi:large subunit ribosomal protein L17|tara:strand:- start:3004 stop:3645 length:642 start_codon:yes stop_codon:yes gene_type:complete